MDKDTITISVAEYENLLARIAYLESELEFDREATLCLIDYDEEFEAKRFDDICNKNPIKRRLYNIWLGQAAVNGSLFFG